MRKAVVFLLIAALISTVATATAEFHEITSPEQNSYATVYSAELYEGVPEQWYNPSELGITRINDGGVGEKANVLWVSIPNATSIIINAVFKWDYNGKFYQIANCSIDPGLPEDVLERASRPISPLLSGITTSLWFAAMVVVGIGRKI